MAGGPACRKKSTSLGTCSLHQLTKGAVRKLSVSSFSVHWHNMQPGFHACMEKSRVQLNYYLIQSKEYFEETKMTRGDSASANFENVRTWDYFNGYDRGGSGCVDMELYSMLSCC